MGADSVGGNVGDLVGDDTDGALDGNSVGDNVGDLVGDDTDGALDGNSVGARAVRHSDSRTVSFDVRMPEGLNHNRDDNLLLVLI